MSEPDLRDMRIKVTPETAAVIDATAAAAGVDKSEIARDVLHRWAKEEIRRHKLLRAHLEREGLDAPAHGRNGKGRA
jgi:hypothetical protein